MPHDFRPIRPVKPFDRINPQSFDPRVITFVPDNSIEDRQVHKVSIQKVQMIGAKVYNSMTQSIASNASWHDMTFDTASFDIGDLWDSGDPTKLTVPRAGIWTVSGFSSWASGSDTDYRRLQIVVNASTTLLRFVQGNLGATVQTDVFITSDFQLAEGDVLTLQARQASGGALDIQDGEDDNFFSAVFRGPI